jgi:membrane protease YdiL (CAAX protease family)
MASRWSWLYAAASTFAWAFVAFLVGQIMALAALVLWWHGDLYRLLASPYDGAVVTLSVLVINPVTIAVLVLAARLRSADVVEYLGLVPPQLRMAVIGIIGILVIIAYTDALLFVSGRAIVSPFQSVSYRTAAAEGWWLPLMWFATVVVAPAGEEIMFRGFLFRGFVRAERAAWPAIVAISLLWTGPHVQYDWTGMLEIFVAGIFLGWARWKSGSTLLTIVLHGLFNLEGMIETVLQIKHF